ncbi:hypothetical protein PROFUN_09084 [Planoprotostelium fungivorum]|uniref:Apple domain-containing protein n=1 Tax=Planoprotostelium fungivorum TaxID=1890364 RepID=A0A2P6NII8_9EUKA|nr:hypothetical protein PROFUN_09084 [Planoprotostelium fungivorum]
MRWFALFLIGLTLSSAYYDEETKIHFKNHLKKYGKHYDNPVEFAKRLSIYAKHRAQQILHNLKTTYNLQFKNGTVGWEEELNEFADEASEEFVKRLGLPPGPPPNNTDDFSPASIFYQGQNVKRGLIDWRAQGKVGSVKDQKQCGSCWTFSASAVIETCVAIATGSVPDMSEQQFQDCLDSKRCSPGGGWPAGAIDFAKKQGQSFERDYPYQGHDGSCHSTSKTAHVGQRISGKGEADLERMLQTGAVSVALDASTLQHYGGGVIDAPSSSATNHAVTVVALTSDCAGRAAQCWVVKNSWGSRWGENGFFRVVKGKNSIGVANVVDTATGCKSDGNGGNDNNTDKDNAPYGTIDQLDRPGGDVAVGTAKDAKDCQAQCARRSDCNVFAFDSCGNTCWFKRGNLRTYTHDCRVSENTFFFAADTALWFNTPAGYTWDYRLVTGLCLAHISSLCSIMIELLLNMLPNELAQKDSDSDSIHVQLQKENTSLLILDFTTMPSLPPSAAFQRRWNSQGIRSPAELWDQNASHQSQHKITTSTNNTKRTTSKYAQTMPLNIGDYYYIPSLEVDGQLRSIDARTKNFLIDGVRRAVRDSIPALSQMHPGRAYRTPLGVLTYSHSNGKGHHRFIGIEGTLRHRVELFHLVPHIGDDNDTEDDSDSEEEDNNSEVDSDSEEEDDNSEDDSDSEEDNNSEVDTDSEEEDDNSEDDSDSEAEVDDSEAEIAAEVDSDVEEEVEAEESHQEISVYSGNISGFPNKTVPCGNAKMLRELSLAQIRSTPLHSVYFIQEVSTRIAELAHSRLLDGYTSTGRGISDCMILLSNRQFHSIERFDTPLTLWTLNPDLNHLDLNTRCIMASCVHRGTGRHCIFISHHGMYNGDRVQQSRREMKRLLSDLARYYPDHIIICGGDFNYNVMNDLPESFGAIPYSMARPKKPIDHILYRNVDMFDSITLDFYEDNEGARRVYPLDLNRFLPADRDRLMAISNDTRRWGNTLDHDVKVAVLGL